MDVVVIFYFSLRRRPRWWPGGRFESKIEGGRGLSEEEAREGEGLQGNACREEGG